MNKCPKCGAELPYEALFCMDCLTQVQAPPTKEKAHKKPMLIKGKNLIVPIASFVVLCLSLLCAFSVKSHIKIAPPPMQDGSIIAPVTDENGEKVTDENNEEIVAIVVPVTDKNGENITQKSGEIVYETISTAPISDVKETTSKLSIIDKIFKSDKETTTKSATTTTSTTMASSNESISSNQIVTTELSTTVTESSTEVIKNTVSTKDDFQWDVYNEKARLVKYTGTATTVIVPATYNGLDVAYMANEAFSNNSSIKTIKFESSDTPFVIQEMWSSRPVYFKNLPNLTTVIFPNKSIGQSGPFNDNFATIFSNCPSIANINFDGRTESSSTYFCSIDGVPYFNGYLSYYPVGKQNAVYNVPSICTKFVKGALKNNPYLVTINLNKNTIGNNMESCFGGCSSLIAINVPADTLSKNMRSVDGVLYIIDGCTLSDTYGYNNEKVTYVCYPAGKTDETFHFATGHKLYFHSNSLCGNKYLKTVYLPEGSRCTTTWANNTNVKTVYLKDCEDSHKIASASCFSGKSVLYY